MQERSTIEAELASYQRDFYAEKYWSLHDELVKFEGQLGVLGVRRDELANAAEAERVRLDSAEGNTRAEVQDYQRIQNEVAQLSVRKNALVEDVAMVRGKLEAQKNVGSDAAVTDAKSLDLEKNNLENQARVLRAQLAKDETSAGELDAQLAAKRAALEKISVLPAHEVDLEAELDALDAIFEEFYGALTKDFATVLSAAEKLKAAFVDFKRKAKNPAQNLEAQLKQKDEISAELSRLDLEKSKIRISREYAQAELGRVEQKILRVSLDLQQASAVDRDEYFSQLLAQEQKLSGEIATLATGLSELEQSLAKYHEAENARRAAVAQAEKSYRALQDELAKVREQESGVRVEKAKLDTQVDALAHDVPPEVFASIRASRAFQHVPDAEAKIARLANQLAQIGGMDELTVREYQETEQRYAHLDGQVKDLQQGIADLRAVIEELDRHIRTQFDGAFSGIDEKVPGLLQDFVQWRTCVPQRDGAGCARRRKI